MNWIKRLALCTGILLAFAAGAQNLLTDPSFENVTGKAPGKRYIVDILKDWNAILNSGYKKGRIELSTDAKSGKQALRIHTIGKAGFNSVSNKKLIPVSEGDVVTATVMFKGKGTGYIRVYYHDANGKYLKKYKMLGSNAKPEYSQLLLRFKVPAGVKNLRFALETLRNDADVIFDDACLTIAQGDVLENRKFRLTFNPRIGGVIDSMLWKERNLELTAKRRFGGGGALFNTIVPDKRIPGVFVEKGFSRVAMTANSATYRSTLDHGELNGLQLDKCYTLTENGVAVKLTFTNTGKQKITTTCRVQNFVPSLPGAWSWPTQDWVTIFRQGDQPLNGMNAYYTDQFRAGWIARYYNDLQTSLVCSTDSRTIRRLYSYFSRHPGFGTMEYYLNQIKLEPGEKRSFDFTLDLVPGKREFYADAKGEKQRFEVIEPIKLPPAPKQSALPENFRNVFPHIGGLGNLNQPEMAGATRGRYPQLFAKIAPRLFRIQLDGYINGISPSRLIYGNMHEPMFNEKGEHVLGEMLNRYDAFFILSTLTLLRSDVDVDTYMKKRFPAIRNTVTHPALQRFIKKYQSRIPVFFTGDELLPQNIDVMLKINEELKKILPGHIAMFPYLNSVSMDFIPYVPVFVGDFYPVKRQNASGRNPWSVYTHFSEVVKRAGDTPVWFMPQGFGSGPVSTYAFPTAAEISLMLHLALAAGVKGVAWHGFPSGTWPWMMNYSMYRYSMLGGAGQRSPSWAGVVDASRAMASAGGLLLRAKPVKLPAGAAIQSRDYTSKGNFYSGAAVRLFALQAPKGTVFAVINQNVEAPEKATVTLPKGKLYDLIALKELSSNQITLTLQPGSAAYFYCGKTLDGAAPALRGRFAAERRRYLLLADSVKGHNISSIDPDSLAKLPPHQAVTKLVAEYAALEKRIAATPIGKLKAQIAKTREVLEKIEFRLCRAMEVAVPKEVSQKTGRYARFAPHPDKEFMALRTELAAAYADFYAISDQVDEGIAVNADAVNKMCSRLESAAAKMHTYLDKYKDRIDDPYAN